jgi:hypothetical protein
VSRTDPDGDDKAQQKREEREKEPEQELEEGLDISRLIGNALRASLGSGSMGATIDLAGPRRGDPGDVEDLGGPAAPPDGPEDVVIDTLGDPEWSPPPRPAGPLIAPSERLASPELRDARMNLVEDRAESADAGEDAWRVPTGDTVATALRPWAVAASRLAGDDEPGRMLAWWAGHGCTTLTSPAARPLVACALASLAWARNGDDDDASRAVRVALEAGRARIEAAEHHWTLAGGGVPTAASLVGTALSASDLPPPPAEPPADLTEASAFWREALAMRPGRTWRAQHHGPPDSTPDDVITRLIGPGAVEPADRRREHVAELGIGLFRELIRHRVRVSAAAVVLADAVLPMMYADIHPGLIDLVARVDQVTQDGLTTLHRLGRGLHLKPYLDDATARAMVDLVAGSVDRAAAAWVRQLATLTAHALGGADLASAPTVQRPTPSTRRCGPGALIGSCSWTRWPRRCGRRCPSPRCGPPPTTAPPGRRWSCWRCWSARAPKRRTARRSASRRSPARGATPPSSPPPRGSAPTPRLGRVTTPSPPSSRPRPACTSSVRRRGPSGW